MGADNASADWQTKAGTFLFVRDEWLKQIILIFRWNAVTGICYRKYDSLHRLVVVVADALELVIEIGQDRKSVV